MPVQTETKKLLALDGGGIRGALTIEVLAEIEAMLRDKLGNKALVLADYFDYIGGTSTGAIIAATLSIGMTVDEIRKFYEKSGREMFDKAALLDRFRNQYKGTALSAKLQGVFGNETLGSPKLRTLLMMVLRNATTDSPWPLSSNPKAKYNNTGNNKDNLKLPLCQLVRASTAAPTYFPPEKIVVGNNEFLFVDGGVTMYNNPAFQLFLMATLKPYNLNWETGEDKMLLVSVGTGHAPEANQNLSPGEMNLLYNASSVPAALMAAALHEQDLLCRAFGKCLVGAAIDRELGDLIGVPSPAGAKAFTYLRYNAELSAAGLAKLGVKADPKAVQQMDSVDAIADLQRIGRAVAKAVDANHYQGFLG